MKRSLALFPLLVACAASAAPGAEDIARHSEDSRKAAATLMQQLAAELKQALAESGPESAISVCKVKAPAIAADVSKSAGMSVARVSLKPRNTVLGTPDEWEARVLADFDARAAGGDKLDAIEHAEVVSDATGRKVFRYMKAAGTQQVCLTCHGPTAQMSDALRARLAAEYPADKATGYALGQVRGAVSVRRPL
jgi:hypothetical protein